MTDKPQMTASEVYALYEKEVASIRAARDAGEHLQGVTMAMNEARRWLDRELDLALPDPNTGTPKLGDRLRHNIAEAERLKLERAERADREAREKRERHRREVSIAFDKIKSKVASSIQEGSVPEPMRMPRLLERGSQRWGTPITSADHDDHQQWQEEMESWAQEQGLVLSLVDDHDGMGMESWQNLVVRPA